MICFDLWIFAIFCTMCTQNDLFLLRLVFLFYQRQSSCHEKGHHVTLWYATGGCWPCPRLSAHHMALCPFAGSLHLWSLTTSRWPKHRYKQSKVGILLASVISKGQQLSWSCSEHNNSRIISTRQLFSVLHIMLHHTCSVIMGEGAMQHKRMELITSSPVLNTHA